MLGVSCTGATRRARLHERVRSPPRRPLRTRCPAPGSSAAPRGLRGSSPARLGCRRSVMTCGELGVGLLASGGASSSPTVVPLVSAPPADALEAALSFVLASASRGPRASGTRSISSRAPGGSSRGRRADHSHPPARRRHREFRPAVRRPQPEQSQSVHYFRPVLDALRATSGAASRASRGRTRHRSPRAQPRRAVRLCSATLACTGRAPPRWRAATSAANSRCCRRRRTHHFPSPPYRRPSDRGSRRSRSSAARGHSHLPSKTGSRGRSSRLPR